MKKIVAIIVSLMCILALLPVGTYAADNPADLTDEIFENVYDWHFWNGFMNWGFEFEAGSCAYESTLIAFMRNGGFPWHKARYEAANGVHYVPAAEYEKALCNWVYVDDATLAKFRKISLEYVPESPDTRYVPGLEIIDGVEYYSFDRCHVEEPYYALCDEYYGYKENGDGSYTAYLFRSNYDLGYVEDVTGLVENVDYVYGRAVTDHFTSTSVFHKYEYKYCPLTGVYEATLAPNADGELVITSYIKVDSLPALDDSAVIRPNYENDGGYTYVYDRSGCVEIDWKNQFPNGTSIKVTRQENDEWCDIVSQTFIEDESKQYLVFKFTVENVDGIDAQPQNPPITVTFDIPSDYGKNVQLFYVDNEGKVETVKGSVSSDGKQFVAQLEHFSTYVLADMKEIGEEDEVITNSKIGYAPIVGEVTLIGRDLKANEFRYELRDVNGNLIGMATNDENGEFRFRTLTFAKAGLYVYRVNQVNDGLAGVSYDTTERIVYVHVWENGNGGLVSSVMMPVDVDCTNFYYASLDN